MPKYLALLRGSGAPSLSPHELQKVVQKYMSWSDDLRKAGRVIGAEKLRFGEGRVLRGNAGKMAVTDGPYVESKEIVGGFWLIEAGSYDEMLEILSTHPHLEGAGSIEVREIEDTSRRS